MTRDALLAAVAADPDADLPRLVYADWLDDHGDADRAEFIRLQCQTARTDPTDPNWLPAKLREYGLFERHREAWLSECGYSGELRAMLAPGWRRGFTRYVHAGWGAVAANGFVYLGGRADGGGEPEALALPAEVGTVRGVILPDLGPPHATGLLADGWRGVSDLHVWRPGVDAACRFLQALPPRQWPGFRRLRLDGPPADAAVEALSTAPAIRSVVEFELCLRPPVDDLWPERQARHRSVGERLRRLVGRPDGVSPAALRVFAGWAAGRTEQLRLWYPTGEQIAALFRRHRWGRLRTLALVFAMPEVLPELSRADLPALTDLTVRLPSNVHAYLPADRLRVWAGGLGAALAGSRVDRLGLSGWPADAVAAVWPALGERPLRRLDVWTTGDRPPPLADLPRWPALRSLQTIHLGHAPDRLGELTDPAVFPELHSVRVGDRATVLPAGPLRWRGGPRTVVVQSGGGSTTAYTWTAD